MPDFPPLTHVAVTVSDLSVSVPWYQRLIGADPVLDEDTGPFHHVVFAIGGTLLGLHTFPGGPAKGDVFQERIVDAPYGSGFSFRDPDNIALEFFAPPA